jgi:hypothetical protein
MVMLKRRRSSHLPCDISRPRTGLETITSSGRSSSAYFKTLQSFPCTRTIGRLGGRLDLLE